MAICRELPVSDGSLYVGGSIAYSSQQPWVFTANIRQNILFGREYDEQRYNDVINACSLDKVSEINRLQKCCLRFYSRYLIMVPGSNLYENNLTVEVL